MTAMMRTSIVCPRSIEPGEMRRLYQTARIPANAAMKARERERERAVQPHVEAERAHARRLVAQALQRQPERRARRRSASDRYRRQAHDQRDVVEPRRVGARVADDARAGRRC